MHITINGPAGVGKGTVAKALARTHGLVYVDAGLLFRFAAYAYQGKRCQSLAELTSLEKGEMWKYIWNGKGAHIELDGRLITDALVRSSVADAASRMAANANYYGAMKAVVEFTLGATNDVVVDGRSAGTGLLPDADVKFYLDAPLEVRAQRRFNDLKGRGMDASLSEVLDSIRRRDSRDRRRQQDPLRIPHGAYFIDTNSRAVSDVLEAMECVL